MSSCHSRVGNFEFSQKDIAENCKKGGLLSMEVEFSLRCNFNCPYCYVPEKFLKNELTPEEIRSGIKQAKELGARKIIILGGEPMIYPYIMDMIKFIKDLDLDIELFTNGFNITEFVAKQLFKYKVNVVLKMNSFDKKVQNLLTGKKDGYEIIQNALGNLKKAGYPSEDPFLAVSTIICRLNLDELPRMWEWLRDQNIAPYVEMITPQGNTKENEWLYVDSQRTKQLFDKIQKIDREKYGYIWDAQPPLIGNRCLRHKFSCLLTAQGYIMPCVGLTAPLGNIRNQPLKEILSQSEILQALRNHKKTIKGPCGSCEKSDHCYGCRGAAFQLTGDYLASDPLCWFNQDKKDQIRCLPTQVNDLIPQKSPMRMIDRLLKIGEKSAVVEANIKPDNPFVSKEGTLQESIYMELIAQSIAAMHGFKDNDQEEGFLLGTKNLEICQFAHIGDKLKISVFKTGRFGEFGIVKGYIKRDEELLAQGEIKIWHKNMQGKDKGSSLPAGRQG